MKIEQPVHFQNYPQKGKKNLRGIVGSTGGGGGWEN